MANVRFSNVVTTLLVVGLGGLILFYPKLGLNSQMQVKLMTDGINSILRALNFKNGFSQGAVVDAIVFMEYSLFGLFLMVMLKSYTDNIAKNIAVPLFLGLLMAVASGYMSKFLGFGIVSLDVVVWEFVGILIGIFMYLVLNRLLENKFGRGGTSKYSKRR